MTDETREQRLEREAAEVTALIQSRLGDIYQGFPNSHNDFLQLIALNLFTRHGVTYSRPELYTTMEILRETTDTVRKELETGRLKLEPRIVQLIDEVRDYYFSTKLEGGQNGK